MSPFSYYLQEIRKKYGISQRQLAARMGYEQAYISGLELDKKGPPNEEFLKKLVLRLGLNQQEVKELCEAVDASQRRFVIPQNATINEYKLVNELWWHIGSLLPAQISMIREVLNLPEQLTPAIPLEKKQEAKM
jgi:transcriptional regulator with XRE-family HTH domain